MQRPPGPPMMGPGYPGAPPPGAPPGGFPGGAPGGYAPMANGGPPPAAAGMPRPPMPGMPGVQAGMQQMSLAGPPGAPMPGGPRPMGPPGGPGAFPPGAPMGAAAAAGGPGFPPMPGGPPPPAAAAAAAGGMPRPMGAMPPGGPMGGHMGPPSAGHMRPPGAPVPLANGGPPPGMVPPHMQQQPLGAPMGGPPSAAGGQGGPGGMPRPQGFMPPGPPGAPGGMGRPMGPPPPMGAAPASMGHLLPGMPGLQPPGPMPGGGLPPMGAPQHMGPPHGPPPPGAPHMAPPLPGQMPQRQVAQARIDPAQIPRPLPQPSEVGVFETRQGGAHAAPPPSGSKFIVRDRGSASPRLMRATLNAIPATTDLLTTSGMPLGCVVAPLALPDPQDDPVLVVDLGDIGPVRCSRCKAYMNPYMRWVDSGKAYVCNFCNASNPCPEAYFNYLGPDGRRRDVFERAELSCGTYEIKATKDYMVRPPQPVIHLFLVEVSHAAVVTGATAAACQCIEQVLESIQGGEDALVGIVTYDAAVHAYHITAGQAQPRMLVMPDTAEPYAPMPAAWLAKAGEAREQLTELLAAIPGMFGGAAGPEAAGAAALEACIELLRHTGGKISAFMASLPNTGSKALKAREGGPVGPSGGAGGAGAAAGGGGAGGALSDKDKVVSLLPQDNTYATLAAFAADYNVCVDLYLVGQGYTDTATLGLLPGTTGGSLYSYVPFSPAGDQDQLLNDLKWNLRRPQGLEAIMRVRVSNGLDVDGYLGSFYKPPNSPTDIYLPAIDCDKAILARLTLTEKLTAGSEVYLQSALLYTTTDGQRRIRVSTLALPVVDQMGAVFKGADLDAQLVMLARNTAAAFPGAAFGSAKDGVQARATATLAAYRKHCAATSSAVQLILPEALKLLPLYALALLKSPGFRPDTRPDERALFLNYLLTAGPARTMGLLHPRLYPLHRLLVNPGMVNGGQTSMLPPAPLLPEPMALSSESLEEGGVFLIDSGRDLLVFVDGDAPTQLLQDLFGVSTPEEVGRCAPGALGGRDTPAGRELGELLTRLRQDRCAYMRGRLTRKGDPLYPSFLHALVEDRGGGGMSYVEWLCHIHRQIQEKVS